jgi:beta-N-acetylhexosaminidase
MIYNLRRFIILFFLITLFYSTSMAQWPAGDTTLAEHHWVDSVFQKLSTDERIAQLFMVRGKANGDTVLIRQVADMVKWYNIGGICFFKGGPVKQAELTNKYQKLAKTPLLISIDGEWGLGMRLDSTISFARQMTLGAMADRQKIYSMGAEIARQCKRLGIHINFAPVADINSNPLNPVINIRSFGEDREDVARMCLQYVNGLQDNGVMAVAKHFPGHGDAGTDSHLTLPVINHSAEALDTLDLYPFRKVINANIGGMMVAHLNVPALDSTPGLPSTLSPKIINGLLKQRLGFKGLVFTDAMDMKGLADFAEPGMIEVKALAAGNDVLLLLEDVPDAICEISAAMDSNIISKTLIEQKCLKVLHLKYRLGLWKPQVVEVKNLISDLNPPEATQLNRDLYNSSVTLLRNTNDLLPLKNLDTLRLASIVIGDTAQNSFQDRLGFYASIDRFSLPYSASSTLQAELLIKLQKYNLVLVGILNTNPSPAKNFSITNQTVVFIDSLQVHKDVVLDLFGLPYALNLFNIGSRIKALLVSYQDNPLVHDVSAQIIMGGMQASGRLPVTATPEFKLHDGISTGPPIRLAYASPEALGIHTYELAGIDSLAEFGIRQKAYPGCQILVAKNGVVIYNKAFGNHTYSNELPVKLTDLYDLASITKVAATTLAVMRLHDEGKIEPGKKLSKYLGYLDGSDKDRLTVREVMAHQAGLQPWIPFYKRTLQAGLPDTSIYKSSSSVDFPDKVADRLYIRKGYHKIIFDSIVKSPLLDTKDYKYSDLDLLLMGDAVEKISGKPLNVFLNDFLYKPMGLPTIGYHPRWRFGLNSIPPTENDTIFRKQVIHGDVHDPAAAMLGGVAGHAGLFSNAIDLAALMQMLLWNGEYGGKRYITPATIEEFTRVQFPLNNNRRGMGFDKPALINGQEGPCSADASPLSFGHSGFTGTFVWTDPAEQLVYVFLSNRVYPDAENTKLAKLNIRTDIQHIIYRAISDKHEKTGN